MLEGEKNKRKEKERVFIANHLKVTNFVIYLSHKNKRHYHIQIERDKTEVQELKGKFHPHQVINREQTNDKVVYKSLHQDDKYMSYHNLAKYWNGDHILYTIYDIVLPAFLYLKPKHENLDPYHFIDFKIRQERN